MSTLTRRIGWLPGLGESEVERRDTLVFPGVELETARLSAAGLTAVLKRLEDAQAVYLSRLPVSRVLDALDRAASRWLDPTSPYRAEAERLLPLITGYSEPAIRKGLASFLGSLRRENLERMLEQELADPAVLDGFRPLGRGGGETRAFGPRLITHIWSGNVPGLPAQSLATALLTKSASLGKVASEEPLFASLLAESIAEVDEQLGACVAVTWWPGGDDALECVAFQQSGAVIAYGSERAMAALRERIPRATRFVEYGHRLSFGVIARDGLAASAIRETAERAAYDVAKYDQQGCLSPHLIYVERGGDCSPREFAEALGAELSRLENIVPRGRISLEEASSAASLRQRYELRQAAGEEAAVIGQGAWAVLYDEQPEFQASCLNRTVFVKPVQDVVQDVPELVAPVRGYLQTCGVIATEERRRALAGRLGELGLDRVCPLGRMADVAPEWHHDGRFNLLDLLRWTDLEPEASAGRWEFSHPDLGLYGK